MGDYPTPSQLIQCFHRLCTNLRTSLCQKLEGGTTAVPPRGFGFFHRYISSKSFPCVFKNMRSYCNVLSVVALMVYVDSKAKTFKIRQTHQKYILNDPVDEWNDEILKKQKDRF